MLFGYLYSPAYPLGTRLGITVFWQPAAIQDFFLLSLTRRCLVISQWLILWFYTQKIYFSALDIVNITTRADTIFLSLSYLGIPRFIWRRKRRRFGKKRRRWKPLIARRIWQRNTFFRCHRYQFQVTKASRLFLKNTLNQKYTSTQPHLLVPRRSYQPTTMGINYVFGQYFQRYNQKLKTMHIDMTHRVLTGFYRNLRLREMAPYFGPKHKLKRRIWVFRRPFTRRLTFIFKNRFNLLQYRQIWFLTFLTRRRAFFGRFLFRRFRRKMSNLRARITHLRFFWYIKLCFESYFKRRIALSCNSLFLAYFQPSVISRLILREPALFQRYINTIKQRRGTQISRFRLQAQDLSFRPAKPLVHNKFSYAQIVLFLGLPPMWRKLVNAYTLCYIIIVSSILKNLQMLAQWLYNMVSIGHTRRFRLLRMRFFMLVAKLLRDYGVFGQYLKGFRIEVYGKTSRSQKTRTRFFGDNTGLRFYRLSFRMNYQAFDIPTFAGVLGVRFWLY